MGQMDKGKTSNDLGSTSEALPELMARFVDRFYAKLRNDPKLEYVIDNAIAGDWAGHLARMRAFWTATISPDQSDPGDPVDAHLRLEGMDRTLLAKWLAVFDDTCKELPDKHLADALRVRAARIGDQIRFALSYGGAQSDPGSAR